MITKSVVEFCQFLRANGFSIGIKETIDSLSATNIVTITDRDAFKSALRSLLSTSREEFELFDPLFERYWHAVTPRESQTGPRANAIASVKLPEGNITRGLSEAKTEAQIEERITSGASAVERLKRTDFSQIPLSDLPLLEQIALQLWRKMSMRLMRRWRIYGTTGRLDLRRTIRHSINHGGEPLDLVRKGRKKKKMRLVTLLDVSGSMDLYSAFLLRFLYALNRYFKRVDSFLFSTRLIPISRTLRKDQLSAVLGDLTKTVEEWSGGTRIGDCLQEFNLKFASKALTKNTVVIILSDGWDTGTPQLLSDQLAKIKRRARKLIWLNPLLGVSGYEPITRGMSTARPYADVFAPAHNLDSLLALEKHWSL